MYSESAPTFNAKARKYPQSRYFLSLNDKWKVKSQILLSQPSSLNQFTNDELCLGVDNNIAGCNGNGSVLCEISLNNDTHICLDDEVLSSVQLNFSTQLHISNEVSILS